MAGSDFSDRMNSLFSTTADSIDGWLSNHTRVKRDAYDQYSAMSADRTVRNRDVYRRQQIERSRLSEAQTFDSRRIMLIVGVTLLFLLLWFAISFVEWFIDAAKNGLTLGITSPSINTGSGYSFWHFFFKPSWFKFYTCVITDTICGVAGYLWLKRNLAAQNADADLAFLNQWENDQHIAFPEEIMDKFDFFADAGAHCGVSVSSLISHVAFQNKGLNPVYVVNRHADKDDDSEFYATLEGDFDDLDIIAAPAIDEEFAEALFDASGVSDKNLQIYWDTTTIPYNPANENRERLKGYDTVADLINGDWELPLYEPQRPGGAYIVDTAPVNTMVLAITRAGKGQTIIEPTIDMWLREKSPNNMVINDPKGELLVKNYVPATVRGFQPVQFNLINALKTDIYNPLLMAAQAAREGDSTKCAMYIENIAEVFFPLDGGEDPVWPNAANNAFKRAAYGLIDYYLEEERQLRRSAQARGEKPAVIDTLVDQLWGKVTLYNSYQLFVQLTAKKRESPKKKFQKEYKECLSDDGKGFKPDSKFGMMSNDEFKEYQENVILQDQLWDGSDEIDLLTLYFNATDRLPRNSMRTLVGNANNALKAMGGAEKMMASVYGIAITAMSFFADPTISTLTSGTPSQNVDLAGLSFPRRIGVRLHPSFIEKYHLTGLQCRWQAFADPNFEQSLGRDFYHEDLISREGWARFYFKGILPRMTSYFRLQILNPQTGVLVRTLYFRFDKAYQTSLDGRQYVTDPILDQKIIKNGSLTEYRPLPRPIPGKPRFVPGKLMFDGSYIEYQNDNAYRRDGKIPAVMADLVRYSEKPKCVFLVTPPHLMKYAKLILIMIKQLCDLNFDQSYMTKSNQKPLYKTRFMLDELGNLQSEGHGISGFETMLSIGLGQEQQFTLILQTLQQLRDVYGDSVDKIVQGNAQPLSSRVATPLGWKTMGDMEVGTEVLTPSGKKSQVAGVYPRGVRKVYKVTRRDGSSCLVCNEHLWKVKVTR